MATQNTPEDWEAVREHFTLLYRTNILSDVMILMERDLNFKASERKYKDQIKIWGLRTYKKKNKNSQLEAEDTGASETTSLAVSSDGDTGDHSIPAGSSICPSVNDTGERRARVSRMPKQRAQRKADAQDPPAVCNERVSTRIKTSSNLEPTQSPTPPIQRAAPDYSHGDFDASSLVPGLAVLPVFAHSRDELETMGITAAARDGPSQTELASERPGEMDVGQSFGSSNQSSGTIDSNPISEHEVVEGEYLRELYGAFGQQSSH